MPPLLDNKDPSAASVFVAPALLREARRQKGIAGKDVPSVCILDPDGDMVRRLRASGQAKLAPEWPCYHTELYRFTLAGTSIGIIGCAVGAPFAVLVAEELFACGCQLLISVTSAGQITPAGKPPYFVVIDRALRDEGTSYHYAAPSDYSEADPHLVADLVGVRLVMGVVMLGPANGLLHHRVQEAALDLDHDGLVLLVADDFAFEDTTGHLFTPWLSFWQAPSSRLSRRRGLCQTFVRSRPS